MLRPLLLLLASVLGGCALFTTIGGPAQGFTPGGERVVPGTPYRDWKGVIHCHSFLSHDSKGTIPQIAAAANTVGLDFLVMTDHQTPHSISRGTRGLQGQTLFLVGAELRAPGGTLLAFPLRHYVRPQATLAAMIDDIHEQGGLAFACHAERFDAFSEPGLDGIELVNLHAAALRMPNAELVLKGLLVPLHELLTGLTARDARLLANFDQQLAHRGPWSVIGGNDAHNNVSAVIATLGTYEELFRTLTTHVLAERCDEAALVAAIRAGRTYVAFDLWHDATGFDFRAQDGEQAHLTGARVAAGAALELCVRTPIDAEIVLLCGGRIAHATHGRELRLRAPPPGDYRVEVYLPERRPWIYSGAIRVQG